MFSLLFMKAFIESYSKQLEQCTCLRMFIMDGPLFLGGRAGDWKFQKKQKQKQNQKQSCTVSTVKTENEIVHGKKHRASASTVINLIFFYLNPIQTGLFWSICDRGGVGHRTPPSISGTIMLGS